jgi:hypothetical protein
MNVNRRSGFMIETVKGPRLNGLLAALPEDIWQRWQSMLESTEIALGQVMYEPAERSCKVPGTVFA